MITFTLAVGTCCAALTAVCGHDTYDRLTNHKPGDIASCIATAACALAAVVFLQIGLSQL